MQRLSNQNYTDFSTATPETKTTQSSVQNDLYPGILYSFKQAIMGMSAIKTFSDIKCQKVFTSTAPFLGKLLEAMLHQDEVLKGGEGREFRKKGLCTVARPEGSWDGGGVRPQDTWRTSSPSPPGVDSGSPGRDFSKNMELMEYLTDPNTSMG